MKRAFDIVISSILLLVSLPVIVMVFVGVLITLGKPVFFRQKRPGLNGIPIELIKFRTMKLGSGPDEERLTAFGSFLRSTSLDELPELVSVLRGDMSLVGPRPLLMEYLDLYSDHQARRHEVRPGITGLAQINGRNSLSWEDRFDLDVEYVENATLINDLKILAITVKQVLAQDGISAEGSVTMQRFEGTTSV